MSPRGRLAWLLLATVCCSPASRQFPMGPDLSRLPRQGDAPLCSLVPGPAWALIALRDPLQRFERWRASPSGKETRLFDDLPLLPWVQRWQALRNRLSEESRRPLPDLGALLDGPVVLGAVPGDAARPVAFILVERLSPLARPALELAQALNAVHPAGQDVEVERYLGIPLRRVRVGVAQWVCYYVLADRLAVGSDLEVLKRSLTLALSHQGASAADQPLLRKAEADGLAGDVGAAFDGEVRVGAQGVPRRSGTAREAVLGIRNLVLAGPTLAGDLDRELWGSGPIEFQLSADRGLEFRASSLDLRAAWQGTRPKSLPNPQEMALVEDLDGLAASLGHGLEVRIGWDETSQSELAVALRVQARDASQAALVRLLGDALSPGQSLDEERSANGLVTCPRKGNAPPAFCAALSSDTLTFGTSRTALAASRSDPTPRGADGGVAVPRLVAELQGASSGFVGRWSVEP